ncbi:MAG: hypothetical protein IJQ43_06180 [Oscillospiraceae bacterium]|nr:hypothetical protein [Oscillospiraceae bacterium]
MKRKKGILVLLALLIVGAGVAAAVIGTRFVRVGGKLLKKEAVVDARTLDLTVGDYEAAAAKYPEQTIRWSVPIGQERFDSFSERIAPHSLPPEELDRLRFFPALKSIDASGCTDYEALAEDWRALEDVDLRWSVPSADGAIDGRTEKLEVKALSAEELRALIALLPELKEIDLRPSSFSDEETDALRRDFAGLDILFDVRFWGLSVPGDARSLTLPEGAQGETEELCRALDRLEQLESADLRGAHLGLAELAAVLEHCPEETLYEVPLYDLVLPCDCEEFSLAKRKLADTAELEAAAALLPKLKKVDMCGCGFSNEEMDALNKRHEGVNFVWEIRFSLYTIRTDSIAFCASNLPNHGWSATRATDEQIALLRYCKDLIALDLGHMGFSDLSFLESLPHLKYLILVEERLHDITPIGTLEELEYLEIFINRIDDVTPLLNCKNLRHLNMCYTRGYDPEPLKQMTWLERLWLGGSEIKPQVLREIAAALPDTQCSIKEEAGGSTGGGWRDVEVYFKMRDLFGMFYQSGGTGV